VPEPVDRDWLRFALEEGGMLLPGVSQIPLEVLERSGVVYGLRRTASLARISSE